MKSIVLTNDFHGTRSVVRARANGWITELTRKRIKRILCRCSGCTCSDEWGRRGPQPDPHRTIETIMVVPTSGYMIVGRIITF
jgi:hypothetical protein